MHPTSPVNHRSLAVYDLSKGDDGELRATNSCLQFDPKQYSRFKYGDLVAAESYGYTMARLLLQFFSRNGGTRGGLVVVGTPFKRLPNAARLLSIIVDRHLRSCGVPSRTTNIYQHQLAVGDYGTLSQADRDARNDGKLRFLDPKDFEGKHVLLIDDIRVTGSIERSTLALLNVLPISSLTVCNLMRIDPAFAVIEPQIENMLNHASINSLDALLLLLQDEEHFTLTTRAVKYVLESNIDSTCRFLDSLTPRQLGVFYDGVIDDGYDQMPAYKEAFEAVFHAQTTRSRKR